MNNFLEPPLPKDTSNEIRKVGFELEYSGLTLKESAQLIIDVTGSGSIEQINPYHYKVLNTAFGDFSLVLDFQFLISQGLEKWLHDVGLDEVIDTEIALALEEFVATLSETIVPYEIATPPLALDKLDTMEELKESLRNHGALGTTANPFYAFGFHINPQVHSFDVAEIVDTLRAFFLLYDYLVELLQPDIKRRITPYIDPYEDEYIAKVLEPSYKPNIDSFIKEYLIFNPTRNRALDLLPLLAFIDAKQVFTALPDEKISARPTYHYRLPNSKVDESQWHTYDAWNSWVMVEELAHDKEALKELSREYLKFMDEPLAFLLKDGWIERVKLWHKNQK
jgi:hypothetical protein